MPIQSVVCSLGRGMRNKTKNNKKKLKTILEQTNKNKTHSHDAGEEKCGGGKSVKERLMNT